MPNFSNPLSIQWNRWHDYLYLYHLFAQMSIKIIFLIMQYLFDHHTLILRGDYVVGETIKSLREQKSMTQAVLAKRLCITRSSVNAWEMGISVPSTQSLTELAEIFDVSTDFLLGLDSTSSVNLKGLTEEDRQIVYALISHLRSKNTLTD